MYNLPQNNSQTTSTIVVYGYNEPFLLNPSVGIYVDGLKLGVVGRGGCTTIKLNRNATIVFKCSFRTAFINIVAGHDYQILLSFDRVTGTLNAYPSTNETFVQDRNYLMQKDNNSWIFIAFFILGMLMLLALCKL